MTTIFNKDKVDILNTDLILGESTGVARYDVVKHSVFEDLTEKQLSFFWLPQEISLALDRVQYQNLSKVEQRFFTENLKYQTLLDSIQGRAPNLALLPLISDVAFETWVSTWAFSETIHSRSYTHIMRNCFTDPAKEFDAIIDNPAIMRRAESISHYYDDLIEKTREYRNCETVLKMLENENHNDELIISTERELLEAKRELMKSFYLCMHCINALEAIRFYVSFACTFNFAEQGKMEGNAKIMKFIARDEQLHLKGTQYVIRLLQSGDEGEEWINIANECKAEATKIFLDVVAQEKEWIDHLFSEGNVPGLNTEILYAYVEYLAYTRMKNVGLDTPFKAGRHPIPFMRKWLNSDDVQAAAQETEIMYLVSQIDSDLTAASYESFKEFL